MVTGDVKLAEIRTSILKVKPNELATSASFQEAVRVASQPKERSSALDHLSLLLVVLRHLRAAINVKDHDSQRYVAHTLRLTLAPAFRPGGAIAELLLSCLDNPDKAHRLRGGETLGAASRLSIDVTSATATGSPDGQTAELLVPLFTNAINSGIPTRGALQLVSYTIEAIPLQLIPARTLELALSGMEASDSAALRSNVVVSVLQKHIASGTERTLGELLQALLPLLLVSESSSAMASSLPRYLLPTLFKEIPAACLGLLDILDGALGAGEVAYFGAYIMVASVGCSSGVISLDSISADRINEAIGHEDSIVRKAAFDLLAGQHDVLTLLEPRIVGMFKNVLRLNAVLPGSGARTDITASSHAFFPRLRTAGTVSQRTYSHQGATAEARAAAKERLEALVDFRRWFLTELVDPALVAVLRPPVYRPLVALIHLQAFQAAFAGDRDVAAQVYTAERVGLLIACQTCEFSEVRSRARRILDTAPAPLPGFETIDSPATQALVRSAWDGFRSPRKTQNEAAVAALSIVFERVVLKQPGGDAEAVVFVDQIAIRVESELTRAEEQSGPGLRDLAIHGPLAACTALISGIDLSDSAAHSRWRPTIRRLAGLVDRVWDVTSAVMSLTSGPSGTSKCAAGPAHEIARANEALALSGEDAVDDIEMGAADGAASAETRRVLSACWRATKEATELLSVLVTKPLGSRSSQDVWTLTEIDGIGRRYLGWLHDVRHRGTFSSIAAAFADLVVTLKRIPEFATLPKQWLHLELAAITDDSLSTTRRSAALPYSVLSIVASDAPLLDLAVDRLIELARVSNDATSDITKVHAFNILKTVLLDTRQGKLIGRYFERTIMTAVEAFASTNWNVRNVGLIVFSTLVHRLLMTPRGGQDVFSSRMALAARHTFAAWHDKYPLILPFVADYLGRYSAAAASSGQCATRSGAAHNETAHSAIVPMLIILRSLKWSESGAEIQRTLIAAVRPFLTSKEWQIRRVSAQALCSLYSPREALECVQHVDEEYRRVVGNNAAHGLLCLSHLLIEYNITWDTADARSIRMVNESIARVLLDVSTGVPAVLVQEALEITVAFMRSGAVKGSSSVSRHARNIALDVVSSAGQRSAFGVGREQLEGTCARVLLVSDTHGPSATFTRLNSILSSRSDAVTSEGVHWLAEADTQADETGTTNSLLVIALDASRDHTVRIEALDAIARRAEIRSDPLPPRSAQIYNLETLIRTTKNTLLREAALPVLTWAVGLESLTLSGARPNAEVGRRWESLASLILKHSAETESQPSRLCAMHSIAFLVRHLFPESVGSASKSTVPPAALLCLHRALLALLQDDDDEIRTVAARVVCRAASSQVDRAPRGVCHAKAVEMWWAASTSYLRSLPEHPDGESAKTGWVEWFGELATDKEGMDEDLAVLRTVSKDKNSAAELFEMEKPNLFRDPLVDAEYAARALRELGLGEAGSRSGSEFELGGEGVIRCSPIDPEFAAVRILRLRRGLLDGP